MLVIQQGQLPSTVVREPSQSLAELVLYPADLAGGILLRIGPRHVATGDGSCQLAQRVRSRRRGLMAPPRLRKGQDFPARRIRAAGTGDISRHKVLEPLEPLLQ